MPRTRKSNPMGLPPKVRFSRGKFYYDHGLKDGKRVWEPLGTDLAKAKSVAMHLSLQSSRFGSMAWYLDEFVRWCGARVAVKKLAQRTLDDYTGYIVSLKAYCGHMAPSEVKPHHVQQLLDLGIEMERGVQANREKACLSACFSWMRTRRPETGIVANPCFGVRRNTEKKRSLYVESDDFAAVLAVACPMSKAYATLVYRTLQRPSDVLGWTRANIKNGVLTFKQSKTGAELEIAIDENIQSALEPIKHNVIGRTLIHTHGNEQYTESGIASMWRRYCKKAKVSSFGVMDLRGKGATDMYLAGIPIETISALMGHESITTTEKYIKVRMRTVQVANKTAIVGS